MLYSTIPFSTITFGGFNPLAAIAGLVIFFQISQIYYYGLPENEPSVELSETGSYKYLQKQFIGVQVVTALIACLLYTSPSPRDATLSRMPSSA